MEVTDQTPMPFGKHKGKAMCSVPAVYLLAIFDKGWIADPGVKQYVLNNMQALKTEAARTKRK